MEYGLQMNIMRMLNKSVMHNKLQHNDLHMLVRPCVMFSVLCGDVDPAENVEGNIKDPEHEGHVAHVQTQPQKPCEKQTHIIKRHRQ